MAAGQGFKTFTTGEVLTATDVNGYLMQGVLVFASAAARNAAITSPQEGQFAFTKDVNGLWYYDGATWVASGATGDIEGVTAGTGISGGGTSGTVTVSIDTAVTVDKTTAQTLTNKTLTTPIISSISNTGTLTLPTSTDTLVGRATTDTLTNKTLTSPALTTPTISTLTTAGDTVYGTGSGVLSRLGIGTAGQVLTVNSGATAPQWSTAAGGGGMTLINSGGTTLSGSSVTVSSIPGTYKELRVIYVNLYTSSANPGQGFYMRFNGDSGGNYGRNGVFAQGTVSELNTYATTEIYVNQRVPSSTTTLRLANGLIQIPSYTSTDNTCVYFQSIGNNNTDQSSSQGVGHYDGTAAITSISFHGDQTMGGGTVYVYGVS